MKKNTKKILAFSVLSLFMFAFMMSSVVAPEAGSKTTTDSQDGLVVTIWRAFFGGISFGDGNFIADQLAKVGVGGAGGMTGAEGLSFFLLMFIVFLLIYDIVDMLPFLSEDWMKRTFSIAFVILAFISVDPKSLAYLTSTYQAVGITLAAIIPFIVITAFVWKLDQRAENEIRPAYGIFGTAIWAGFGIFLILKLTDLSKGGFNAQDPIAMAYLVITIVALMAVFFHGKIYARIAKHTGNAKAYLGAKWDRKKIITNLKNENKDLEESLKLGENKDRIDEILKEIEENKDKIAKL